jgi:hypothetical protein
MAAVPPFARTALVSGRGAHAIAKVLSAREKRAQVLPTGEGERLLSRYECVFLLPDTPEDIVKEALIRLDKHGICCVAAKSAEREAAEQLILKHELVEYPLATLQQAGAEWCAVLAVRPDYDPLAHARRLASSNAPLRALAVLDAIPTVYLQDEAVRAMAAAQRASCLVAWDEQAEDERALERLHGVHNCFITATAVYPRLHQAYHAYAEMWSRIGCGCYARTLLASLAHVDPDEETRKRAGRCVVHAHDSEELEPPVWSGNGFRPRVLFITDDKCNHGLDTLYDGLCRTLGAEHVEDYPWKSTLHGGAPAKFGYYPCLFDYPGDQRSREEVENRLSSGEYDLVLYGDTENNLPVDEARALREAGGETPWFLLDMGDDFLDNRTRLEDHLGAPFAACFKREMLRGVDYGPNSFPMPFAYSLQYKTDPEDEERHVPLFWAGNRKYGLRQLFLQRLEEALDCSFSSMYTPDAYVRILDSSVICLDFPGFGFDTVRYWEAPAHGGLLMTLRRPMRIPNNFVDGQHAVFFDDLPDLENKLVYYYRNREEALSLARAGQKHFLGFHTSERRARELLGRLQGFLHSADNRT